MLKQHALVVAVLAMIVILFATLFFATRSIPSKGTIGSVNVDLFWDANLTMPIVEGEWLDWGLVAPGSKTNRSVWVYNPGTLPANISVYTSDWDPMGDQVNATDYLWLDWTLLSPTAPILPVANSAELVLELNVNASVHTITVFTFNMTVVGSWLPPG